MLRSAEKRNRKRERERDDADGMVVMTGIKPIINHQHERTKKSDWSRWKIDAGDKSRFPFESDSIDSTGSPLTVNFSPNTVLKPSVDF